MQKWIYLHRTTYRVGPTRPCQKLATSFLPTLQLLAVEQKKERRPMKILAKSFKSMYKKGPYIILFHKFTF
jgi:hypothetical protein